jgi:DnaJ homolog subfamily C member 19
MDKELAVDRSTAFEIRHALAYDVCQHLIKFDSYARCWHLPYTPPLRLTRRAMATPMLAGMAVAGAAYASRAAVLAWRNFAARGGAGIGGRAAPRFPRSFAGGFEDEMSRKEALNILGLREGAKKEAIRAAHRNLMRANHPDNGGSTMIATKVNEAKDLLVGGSRGSRVL